jgi:hypothetical protein
MKLHVRLLSELKEADREASWATCRTAAKREIDRGWR